MSRYEWVVRQWRSDPRVSHTPSEWEKSYWVNVQVWGFYGTVAGWAQDKTFNFLKIYTSAIPLETRKLTVCVCCRFMKATSTSTLWSWTNLNSLCSPPLWEFSRLPGTSSSRWESRSTAAKVSLSAIRLRLCLSCYHITPCELLMNQYLLSNRTSSWTECEKQIDNLIFKPSLLYICKLSCIAFPIAVVNFTICIFCASSHGGPSYDEGLKPGEDSL